MRRRITWFLNNRTAIAMSPGDVLPTKFEWRDLPRPSDIVEETIHGVVYNRTTYRDFREDEHKVKLLWDGTQCETFLNEVVLKKFIISLVYMIGKDDLIPSELLADANLVYDTGDWVDEWGCKDKNEEIIECPREIYRPTTRKIQIDANFSTQSFRKQHNAKPRLSAYLNYREIPAKVEVSDIKCFYTFRAGGFYEKDQNPLEQTCEKGEKSV